MASSGEMGTDPSRNFGEFVCDAYKFLMDYHQTGDRVYIFGFSRGAYTARALAGMVQKASESHRSPHGTQSGLRDISGWPAAPRQPQSGPAVSAISKPNAPRSAPSVLTRDSAYGIYKTPNKDDREMAIKDKTMSLSTQYRRIFGISRPVMLHFVGVWVSVTRFLTTEHATDSGPRIPCPVLVSYTTSLM
jgi:hypothetical protein